MIGLVKIYPPTFPSVRPEEEIDQQITEVSLTGKAVSATLDEGRRAGLEPGKRPDYTANVEELCQKQQLSQYR